MPFMAEYATRAADDRVVRLSSISESTVVEYLASFHMNVKTSDRLYVRAARPPGNALASRSEAPGEV